MNDDWIKTLEYRPESEVEAQQPNPENPTATRALRRMTLRTSKFLQKRPDPPREVIARDGRLSWKPPKVLRGEPNITHYNIYANHELNRVRQVPKDQLFLEDNLEATQVFVSAWNETMRFESIKVRVLWPDSIGGGDGGGGYVVPPHVYWRLLIYNNSGGQVASLADWKLYDATDTLIPTTGGTALGNDDYYPASNAFDGNPATQWATSPGSNPRPADPDWLRYQFPAAVAPKKFSITTNNTTEFYYAPDSFALQGSDDGTTWTTIGNYTGGPWSSAGETKEYIVAPVGLGDFYRVFLLTTSSPDHYSIPALVFMDGSGSPLSLVDGQAMAGGTYISNNCGPSLAFDGNNATFWRSFGVNPVNPHWLGYRFNGSVTVGSFSIRTRDSIFYGEGPLTFRLEKSTDGGTVWTVIQSYTTPTWTASEVRTFTVP